MVTDDSDGDGMLDSWETANGLSPNDAGDADLDGDSDGLSNLQEFENNTDPANWDSDADGMADGWEVQSGLNPNDATDAVLDTDGDGLSNLDEYQQGSDPTLSPPPTLPPGALAITWTDLVGVTANGNTLTRDGGSGWNAGAASEQFILGDGAVEFTAIATNTHRIFGLSNVNANASWDSIAYVIYARNDAAILIVENGVSAGTFGTYQSGDVLRVERIGTSIVYKQNGNIIYTSAVPSSGSLIADSSIYSPGAQIVNAIIYGASQDADGDLFDDDWETANGLSSSDASNSR